LFKRLICCVCSDYRKVHQEKIQDLVGRARASEIEVKLVPDLCLEIVRIPESFASFADDKTTVLALCRVRTGQAFFARAGLPSPEIIGMNDDCAETKITSSGWKTPDHVEAIALPEYKSDWISWFPVIDKTRCNNCGKCIDFCLFGVYSRQNRQVSVTNPEACKTNCPACSRMCPQKAIIFPKHSEEPFNGAPIDEKTDDQTNEDFSDQDDLYKKLAERRQKQTNRKLLKDD